MVHIDSILYFTTTGRREDNDAINKQRESIVMDIMNDDIPLDYYSKSPNWNILRNNVHGFLQSIVPFYLSVKAFKRAGRGFHCDFCVNFTLADGSILAKKVEWKYGATSIVECPQWVSPMKPSQYLTGSFEEYYYDVDKVELV